MKKHLGLFAVLAVMWWLWSGHTEVLILGFGFFSCLLVSLLASRMRLVDAEGMQVHLFPGLMRYWSWLSLEIFKSNWDVGRRILSGNIKPTIRKIPSEQSSDMGRVIYANSITLTPGTLSFEVESEHIHVHALHGSALEDLSKGKMSARVKQLEDED